MLITESSLRARLKNWFADTKALILEDNSITPRQKYWELQRWVDGFETCAELTGPDTRLTDIIEEITADTLAAWGEMANEQEHDQHVQGLRNVPRRRNSEAVSGESVVAERPRLPGM